LLSYLIANEQQAANEGNDGRGESDHVGAEQNIERYFEPFEEQYEGVRHIHSVRLGQSPHRGMRGGYEPKGMVSIFMAFLRGCPGI